ncbi:MAG: sensor histidine kinase [Anaerolineales bacterium]|nr:sensor histidine kinase [Anaerolineales bacterium]
MPTWNLSLVYFIYGLAFFSMGLAVWIEGGRASDRRLRRALQPLAMFGFVHGGHEWLEMFQHLGLMPDAIATGITWEVLRLAIIALSLLPLATFGALLFALTERLSRLALVTPLVLTVVWGVGTLSISLAGVSDVDLWPMLSVWTRYSLGLPGALLAAAGLVVQQREFRRVGLVRFGRDSLWAAVAFFWYGAVGQVFVSASALPPSNIINQDLFFSWFGVPIQILRAACAVFMALFVIRFLRAFEVETRGQIAALQTARLEESQRREAQRGELLQRVVAAQEAERQRIARELHDATGQSLTALGLGLRSAVALVRQDPTAAEQRLGKIEALTSDTLEELRHLISDLRPSHLDDLGLGPTLRWYAKEVEARTVLRVGVEVSGTERSLDPAVRIALFRIAQEAITNTVKHGNAKSVCLRLCFPPQAVWLSVEDDGQGFSLSTLSDPARPTWGLLGMRERAALLHGQCDIYSRPQTGTRVEVTIPDPIQEPVA